MEEGYVLKSKLLDNLKFGLPVKVKLHSNKNLSNGASVDTFVFIGFEGEYLIALNKKGEALFNSELVLSEQQHLQIEEYTKKISLYDITEIVNEVGIYSF